MVLKWLKTHSAEIVTHRLMHQQLHMFATSSLVDYLHVCEALADMSVTDMLLCLWNNFPASIRDIDNIIAV